MSFTLEKFLLRLGVPGPGSRDVAIEVGLVLSRSFDLQSNTFWSDEIFQLL